MTTFIADDVDNPASCWSVLSSINKAYPLLKVDLHFNHERDSRWVCNFRGDTLGAHVCCGTASNVEDAVKRCMLDFYYTLGKRK